MGKEREVKGKGKTREKGKRKEKEEKGIRIRGKSLRKAESLISFHKSLGRKSIGANGRDGESERKIESWLRERS